MAAQTKADLRSVTEKEFAKLRTLIGALPSNIATRKVDEDTSIKDVIGHRAHWITLFLNWYADGQAGRDVYFPAKGYRWNALKRYNADLRRRQAELGWTDVVALLNANHAQLIDFIDAHSDADLYGGPMKGARNAWTAGRWAEAAGASHYRSAAKYIRAAIRSAG